MSNRMDTQWKRAAGRLSLNLMYWYGRSFPRHRGKVRVIDSYLRHLGGGDHAPRTAPLSLAPARMECDLGEYIQQRLYFLGTYEPEAEALWTGIARQSRTLFDVGANVGIFSLLGATANPDARVHAFEPTASAADVLDRNVKLNALENVVLNRLAVGKRSGVLYLHECLGSRGYNGGMNFTSREASRAIRQVPVVSLDEYCRREAIAVVDAMKVDVEGAEYDVFDGATDLLQHGRVRYILFESSEWTAERFGRKRSAAEKLLADVGYTLYDIETHQRIDAGAPHSGNLIGSAPGERIPW